MIEIEVDNDEFEDTELNDIEIYAQIINNKYLVIRASSNGELSKEARVYDSELKIVGTYKVKSKTISVLGDVNDDGEVNIIDSRFVERYLESGFKINIKNADVNKDGKVTEDDAKILRRYANNWEGYEELPYKGDITVYGDLNDDETINSKDYNIILDYLDNKNVEIDKNAADLFDDGKIDEKDKYLLAYYISVEKIDLPHNCNELVITYKSLNEQEHRVCLNCECEDIYNIDDIVEIHKFENGKCECGYAEKKENEVKEYTDVVGTKYEETINELEKLNIRLDVEGNKYNVDANITRGELAELLGKARGLNDIATTLKNVEKFSDVENGTMRCGYINAIAEAGIINEYPDGSFAPDSEVRYSEAFVAFTRFLGYEISGFPNTSQASSLGISQNIYYKSYNESVTKGDIAIMIWNSINAETSDGTVLIEEIFDL